MSGNRPVAHGFAEGCHRDGGGGGHALSWQVLEIAGHLESYAMLRSDMSAVVMAQPGFAALAPTSGAFWARPWKATPVNCRGRGGRGESLLGARAC